MNSARLICKILEKFGFFYEKIEGTSNWKDWLHRAYQYFQIVLLLFAVLHHLEVTFVICSKNVPMFFESLFEDIFLIIGALSTIAVGVIKNERFLEIVNLSEKLSSNSKSHSKIMRKCEYYCKLFLVSLVVLTTSLMLLNLLETVLPLSEEDLEIRRVVYNTKYPERRLPYHLPSFETDIILVFYATYAYSIYVGALFAWVIAIMSSFIPTILLQLLAQYEILALYTKKIGEKHTDATGDEIFYTNIETNEFVHVHMDDGNGRKYDKYTLLRRRHFYEQQYIKQIVQYHQKLLIFQDKVIIRIYYYSVLNSSVAK